MSGCLKSCKNMEFKIDAAEREATRELIKDFAVRPNVTVEEIYKISWKRFNAIEGSLHKVKILNQLIHDDEFNYNYSNLPNALHFYLYEGLYSFAGQFRKYDDPNRGTIHFGIQHGHQRKPPFTGDSPKSIEAGVLEAVQHLKIHTQNPLYQALRFYQKFVNVHPYYDGNGRIARLIANIYLIEYEKTISWSEFDSKSKFLKRLNRCHLNPSEKTFNRLSNYVEEYTLNFLELDS